MTVAAVVPNICSYRSCFYNEMWNLLCPL